jgi:hypothetical protein
MNCSSGISTTIVYRSEEKRREEYHEICYNFNFDEIPRDVGLLGHFNYDFHPLINNKLKNEIQVNLGLIPNILW